ncbi:hypothetical protein [Halobellus ruber]|uniref:Uncharacterized protein n=1 Tax=Halobellus ruber TaxID=2761102 RepID=A0A7J9SKL8_9EURY|nr:hypothetical protein [Halobellus ruber]MBB6646547.1 hypothetical protein [Halobellus ruber]
MNPHKSLLVAVLLGAAVGGVVHAFLLPDWFFAAGIATIYAGVVYFYATYGITLLGEHVTFRDGPDRLGHAVGLFGLSTTPLALVEYVSLRTPETVGVLVWTTGTITYLLLVSSARTQRRQ